MIVDKYLNYLNEGKNAQDPSLPNPYDYQSIELDPNVTEQDIRILGNWLKKNKQFYPKDRTLDPYKWLYMQYPSDDEEEVLKSQPKTIPYIIVDNGKRVGMVKINIGGSLTWASWVPGHNYATRGAMKLIDNILSDKSFRNRKRRKRLLWHAKNRMLGTTINKENKPSIKVAEKLKMNLYSKFEGDYSYEVLYPIWWLAENKQK